MEIWHKCSQKILLKKSLSSLWPFQAHSKQNSWQNAWKYTNRVLRNPALAVFSRYSIWVIDLGLLQKESPLADPRGRGRSGRAPYLGPNSFIFMQFSAKLLRNTRIAHPHRKLGRPLGNPGSATDHISVFPYLHGKFARGGKFDTLGVFFFFKFWPINWAF